MPHQSAPQPANLQPRRAAVAAFIGTTIEWYDFFLYGVAAALAQADLILRNGRVHTVDANFSVAQSIAIKNGRFSVVGDDATVMKEVGPATQVIDLAGRAVAAHGVDRDAQGCAHVVSRRR